MKSRVTETGVILVRQWRISPCSLGYPPESGLADGWCSRKALSLWGTESDEIVCSEAAFLLTPSHLKANFSQLFACSRPILCSLSYDCIFQHMGWLVPSITPLWGQPCLPYNPISTLSLIFPSLWASLSPCQFLDSFWSLSYITKFYAFYLRYIFQYCSCQGITTQSSLFLKSPEHSV